MKRNEDLSPRLASSTSGNVEGIAQRAVRGTPKQCAGK